MAEVKLNRNPEPRSLSNESKQSIKPEPQDFPFDLVTVKSEDDEDEWPLHHMSDANGEEAGCSSAHAPPVAKPCSCSWCGVAFRRVADLNRHVLIHTGQRPFRCSVCDQSFRLKNILRVHMRIHTGEKPFVCSVCDKAFAYKQSLEKHKCADPTFTGDEEAEKPYSCSECGKRFSRSSNLKTHMFVHTEERPQKCVACLATFKQKSSLDRHLRVRHGICPSPAKNSGKMRHDDEALDLSATDPSSGSKATRNAKKTQVPRVREGVLTQIRFKEPHAAPHGAHI